MLCRSRQFSSCCCTIRQSRLHWRLYLTQKSKALPKKSRPRKSTMPSPQSSSERMNFNVGWVGCILIKVVAFRIHRCCPVVALHVASLKLARVLCSRLRIRDCLNGVLMKRLCRHIFILSKLPRSMRTSFFFMNQTVKGGLYRANRCGGWVAEAGTTSELCSAAKSRVACEFAVSSSQVPQKVSALLEV